MNQLEKSIVNATLNIVRLEKFGCQVSADGKIEHVGSGNVSETIERHRRRIADDAEWLLITRTVPAEEEANDEALQD